MTQERLSNEEFFRKLAELFATTTKEEHGSVFLTQKRFVAHEDVDSKTPTEDTLADLALLETPGPLLVRATNGKSKRDRQNRKIKIATVVEPEAIDGFYAKYAEVCKTGMTALKKRDRKKKNKKKKPTKAAKEAEVATA
ncbi:signal recognition particle 14kD protein-domain-containing protein [Peziza echinospora]|nr:signal recognition particle 14kD protein-domain-containing protein [Peziza echinospora]